MPSKDSDQPGHPPSLIRVFAVHIKKAWVLSYPLIRPVLSESSLCSQWVAKDPSFLNVDSEDSDQSGGGGGAQADQSLCCAHMPFCHEAAQLCVIRHININIHILRKFLLNANT